jgi:hypothetical protein
MFIYPTVTDTEQVWLDQTSDVAGSFLYASVNNLMTRAGVWYCHPCVRQLPIIVLALS